MLRILSNHFQMLPAKCSFFSFHFSSKVKQRVECQEILQNCSFQRICSMEKYACTYADWAFEKLNLFNEDYYIYMNKMFFIYSHVNRVFIYVVLLMTTIQNYITMSCKYRSWVMVTIQLIIRVRLSWTLQSNWSYEFIYRREQKVTIKNITIWFYSNIFESSLHILSVFQLFISFIHRSDVEECTDIFSI